MISSLILCFDNVVVPDQLLQAIAAVIEAQQQTRNDVSELSRKISNVQITQYDIVPSQACSTNRASEFNVVLEWLQLAVDIPFIQRVTDRELGGDYCQYERFRAFPWGDQNESAGYETMLQYLSTCGLISRKVANGINLYDFDVYSLRDRVVDALTLRNENKVPIHKFHIHGKTDIVVLDEDILTRGKIKFAIEIKTVVNMHTDAKTNQALREAFLQLVGLNVRNDYKSPAVVLTNMNEKHYILYLDIRGDLEAFRFDLKIHKSNELHKVIQLANQIGSRSSFTGRLGKELTPLPTEATEPDEFDNVAVEINPLADLEGLGEDAVVEE
jgi:CRISPR/Cas system-associated exonuclease Cas4 (RecB family)